MKLKFSYWDISHVKNDEPNHRKIRRAFEMIDKSEQIRNSYGQYLLSSLDSDFLENRFGACDELLKEIEKIEAGKIEHFVFDYNGFITSIKNLQPSNMPSSAFAPTGHFGPAHFRTTKLRCKPLEIFLRCQNRLILS